MGTRPKSRAMSSPRIVRFDCVKEGPSLSILAIFDNPEISRAQAYELLSRELEKLSEKKP